MTHGQWCKKQTWCAGSNCGICKKAWLAALRNKVGAKPLPTIKEVLSQAGNMNGALSANERDAIIRAYHIIARQQCNAQEISM